MFHLVKFEDGVLFVCDEKNISNRSGDECIVKYRNGTRYPAKILASNKNKNTTKKLKEKWIEEENTINITDDTQINLSPNTTGNMPNVDDFSLNISNVTDLINSSTLFDENNQFNLQDISDNTIKKVEETEKSFNEKEEKVDNEKKSHLSKEDKPKRVNSIKATLSNDMSISDSEVAESNVEEITDEVCNKAKKPIKGRQWRRSNTPESDDYSEPFEDSGSEYVPSDSGSPITRVLEKNLEQSPDLHHENQESTNASGNDTLVMRTSLDLEDLNVSPSTKKNKKLYCMYCKKFLSKFARHLATVHKDEESVKQFIYLKPGCPERKKIIDTIKKKSQFEYNTQSTHNRGKLLVSRRPQERFQKSGKDFKVCCNCKGFFSKYNLRHHAKKCFNFRGTGSRNLSVMGRKILITIHPEASDKLRNDIFPILKEDIIVKNIRQDRLVILYGNKMCKKYRLQHQNELIRSHLRMIGRFLVAVKNMNPEIENMASLYDPSHYDTAIAAINEISGFNCETNQFKAPSTAYNTGSIIKKIAELQIVDCIKRKLVQEKQNAEDFLKLLLSDISVSINRTVAETQAQHKRRRPVILPSADDIKKLRDHLQKKITVALNSIKEEYNFDSWMSLAEAALTSIQLFNRRRAGECERILIEDYKSQTGIDISSTGNLSPKSRKLAENYCRFEIRGKLNRNVPVLLSVEHKEALEYILKYRRNAGVTDQNRFIFGIPSGQKNSHKYLRACILMRKFSNECGAKIPATLRGTQLRKHVATNCINLDLSQNEVSDMANFMGHSDKIHASHYRQPIVQREILRISRLLEKAQGMEENVDSEESSDEDEIENAVPPSISTESVTTNNSFKQKRSTSPYGQVKRKKRWSNQETETAHKIFKEYIENNYYPSLKNIQKMQEEYPALKNRNPVVIKTWISNQIKKNKTCRFPLNV